MALFSWQYNSQHNSTLAVWYFPDVKIVFARLCGILLSSTENTV